MIYPVFAQAASNPGNVTVSDSAPPAAKAGVSASAAADAAPAKTQQYTEQPAQPAPEGEQPKPGMKDGLLGMAPFIIIVVVMFYLMYRGQKKEQKRRQEMIDGVKKGDSILTIGGIYGEIVEIHEDRFILKIADGVKIAVAKTAISTVPARNEEEKAEKK